MERVMTNPNALLRYRRDKNLDLFATDISNGKIRLSCQATNGIVMCAEVLAKDPRYLAVRPYCNKSCHFDSLMIRTHDFADSTTWGETSLYQLMPFEGYKLIITSIVARFPAKLDLSANNLEFRVYQSQDSFTPITDDDPPTVEDVYTTSRDIITLSNTSLTTMPDPPNEFSSEMYEIKFRYADSDLSNNSKLTLSNLLNERLEVGMQYDTQLVDTDGVDITDPCYLFFNTKRVEDF
jgi:hypothetical protein